jgi:nucleotide-binding universal stress UspA family protein
MNAPTPASKPSTLQHIVAATDFSAPAAMAAERAARLAVEHGARLSLAHVLSTSWATELRSWLDDSDQWQQRLAQQATDSLQAEAARLGQPGGKPVEPLLLQGPPVATVAEAVQTHGADLLALGVRGSSPLHHLLIGTTAERLLRKVACPLLLVRQAPAQPYQRVLIPLDFSPWSEQAVDLARQIAPRAVLVLMHSFTIPFEEKLRFAGVDDATLEHYRERAREDARQQMEAFVQARALTPDRVHLCLTEGDAPQHILIQARERGCDLIVIGKHGRHAAEELLLGSVTKHVVSEAECDVLVSTAHQA